MSLSLKKIILVTGGCMSGLGKGITTSVITKIIKDSGKNITAIKIDPYINASAGTISPDEHGEVFVLADGTEVDLDLGSYERYTGLRLCAKNSITTGKVYKSILSKEERGEYLGQTIQTIPHIRDEILHMILDAIPPEDHSVAVIELGGTVGDIESEIYLEAFSSLKSKLEDFLHIHVTLLPGPNGESQKTKPTQHSLAHLSRHCLQPDILVCRTKEPVTEKTRAKLGSVSPFIKLVLSLHDMEDCSRDAMVRLFASQFAAEEKKKIVVHSSKEGILRNLISAGNKMYNDLLLESSSSSSFIFEEEKEDFKRIIYIIGKYTKSSDAYLSIIKAIESAARYLNMKKNSLDIQMIDSEDEILKEESRFIEFLNTKNKCAVIIPGGFGERGVEGKIAAIHACRKFRIPILGICLGMQLMAIEACREEKNYPFNKKRITSAEFINEKIHGEESICVVKHMSDVPENRFSGTMRLGEKTTRIISEDSLLHQLYSKEEEKYSSRSPRVSSCSNHLLIRERHRHRYEVDPKFFPNSILQVSGVDHESGVLIEAMELKKEEGFSSSFHPFFLGVQFHPEFSSTDDFPSPVFIGLLKTLMN